MRDEQYGVTAGIQKTLVEGCMSKLRKTVKAGVVAGLCGLGVCAVARALRLSSRFTGYVHSIEGVPFPGVSLYSFLASRQLRPLYQAIAQEVRDAGHFEHILDLNTGVGLLPIEIAALDTAAHIVGLDSSVEMIRVAKTNAQASRIRDNIEFNTGDAANLPFPGRYFDLVVSVNALHHWRDPAAAIEEVFHTLKPGGQFWIYDYRCDVSEDVWEEAETALPFYLSFPFAVGPRASWRAACNPERLTSTIKRTHFETVDIQPRTFNMFGRDMPVFQRIVLTKPEQLREE